MKLAPILPASMYAVVDDGDYHWVHASALDSDPVAAGVIEGWCRSPLDTVMLADTDPDALLRVATYISPDEIVCPSAENDSQTTITLAYDYIKDCAKAAKRVMLVPQGVNIEEWVDCYHALMDVARSTRTIVTVGVPASLDRTWADGYRYTGLIYLESLRERDTRSSRMHAVHGIGVGHSFRDILVLVNNFPWVRGWSTTWPYIMAHKGHVMSYMYHDPTLYLGESMERTDDIWEPKVTPPLVTRTAINIAVCRHTLKENDDGSEKNSSM